MKKKLLFAIMFATALSGSVIAQEKNEGKVKVPAAVKEAFAKKYPEATKVTWETEKGNYEANWGGKSGEDNSVVYTPTAAFVEIVKAIPVSALPKPVVPYVKEHYKTSVKEAGKVTDAANKTFYEAEIKGGKDVIFDETGKFVKID